MSRAFAFFGVGQFLAGAGDVLSAMALAWWVLEVTHSPETVSVVLVPALTARVALLPFSGLLADRFPRKVLLALGGGMRALAALVLASSAQAGHYSFWIASGAAILTGVGWTVSESSYLSIVPHLVTVERLGTAYRLAQGLKPLSEVFGALIGGWLLDGVGSGGVWFVAAGAWGVGAVLMLMIDRDTRVERTTHVEQGLRAWWVDLVASLRVVWQIPLLRGVGLVSMLLHVLFLPLRQTVLPAYVQGDASLPAWFLGALQGGLAAGVVIGAVTGGWFAQRLRADAVVVLALVVMGTGAAAFPYMPGLWGPTISFALSGMGVGIASSLLTTQISIGLPDAFRARVLSTMEFISLSVLPLGTLAQGMGVERLGGRPTLLLCMGLAVVVAPCLWWVRHYTGFMRLSVVQVPGFFSQHYPERFEARRSP